MTIQPYNAGFVIIEDNADSRFLAGDILFSLLNVPAQNVTFWASGQQFFNAIEEKRLAPNKIHIIILDIQIPGEDGYQLLQRLRENSRFEYTKIIAFTANVLPDDIDRAWNAGFDGFIGKPIRDKKFADQIVRILHGEVVWEARH